MTKNQQLIEKIIVTAFEAAIAYISINQTNLSGNAKWTAIGALGAALSAAYNVLRQSTPTIPPLPTKLALNEINKQVATLNGVAQLTSQQSTDSQGVTPSYLDTTAAGMPVPPVEPPAPTV